MRALKNPVTGKVWAARTDGATFYSSTGGKEREVACASPEAAREKLTKDVWKKLKDGFVLVPGAEPVAESQVGVADMMAYAGKGFGWGGRASICSAEDDATFFVVNSIDEECVLQRVDPDGTVNELGSLEPNRFVRSMTFFAGFLFLDIDGQVLALKLADNEMYEMTQDGHFAAGQVQTGGGLVVWHDGEQIVVTDYATKSPATRTVFQRALEPKLGELALAVSATHVAYTNDRDTIVVVGLADGAEIALNKHLADKGAKQGPEETRGLWLTPQGSLFSYGVVDGDTALKRYDIGTGELDWQSYHPDFPTIANVTMDRERSRLALLYRYGHSLEVLDAETMDVQYRLQPEYVGRGGNCAFTGTGVALATDHGCLAHYRLDDELRRRTKSAVDAERSDYLAKKDLHQRFVLGPPVDPAELEAEEVEFRGALPTQYVSLLRLADGVFSDEGRLRIFSVLAIARRNREAGVPAGYFLLGDNGTVGVEGDCAVLLNLADRRIYEAPFDNLTPTAMKFSAASLDELLQFGTSRSVRDAS